QSRRQAFVDLDDAAGRAYVSRAFPPRPPLTESVPRPMTSLLDQATLLDQSALTALAERLVAAARRAGADAADAIAERGMSQSVDVRDGTVEASERSEGDNLGLRALVGRRQAVVSTNDLNGNIDALAERAVAMARAAPEDKFAGLADPALLAKS